jgi:hypothetical protein
MWPWIVLLCIGRKGLLELLLRDRLIIGLI